MTDRTELTYRRAAPGTNLVALAQVLADVECRSYTLSVVDRRDHLGDSHAVTMTLTITGRGAFLAVCAQLGVTPREARYAPPGQRLWHADSEASARHLLVTGLSYPHHDDWEPRPTAGEGATDA